MLIFYTLFIIICVFGWVSAKSYKFAENQTNTALSVVVCCKNEQENLPFLLRSLETQISDIEQIIFANDNSTDETLKILQDFSKKFSNVKFFSTKDFGKKNALKEAMQFVENEYVITFDADCIVPQNYFLSVKSFLMQNQPDLMIGGVKLIENGTFFQKIQTLEFASLIASGAGAALAGFPIMCNGANLAFRKNIWQDAENHLVTKEISGDDVFLLHYIKKIGGKISFFKANNAFVETFAARNFGEFLRQRQRWASKSRSYSDWQTICVALLVFGLNFLLIFSAFGAFFSEIFLKYFLLIFCSKMIIDSVLLIPFLIFTKQKKLIKLIPLLSFFYPFYIILTTIFGVFGKVRWK